MSAAAPVSDVGAGLETIGRTALEDIRRLPPSGALDDASVETFYAIGYNALLARKHDDASNIFGMLLAVRPADPRFFAGLGLALKELGDLDTAAMLFSMAAGLDADNPRHHLALAEVLIAQGKRELGRVVLDVVVTDAGRRPQCADVAERAGAMLALLDHAR